MDTPWGAYYTNDVNESTEDHSANDTNQGSVTEEERARAHGEERKDQDILCALCSRFRGGWKHSFIRGTGSLWALMVER